MGTVNRTFYVARRNAEYAYEGRSSGYGVIEMGSKSGAKKAESPAALMRWLGGHYRSFACVKLESVVQTQDLGPVDWPDPKEVFDD